MLVYHAPHGEARAILDQLEIAEMREEGGLQRMMRLLELFGARSDEHFEERHAAFHVFRRTPGMTRTSEYISTPPR